MPGFYRCEVWAPLTRFLNGSLPDFLCQRRETLRRMFTSVSPLRTFICSGFGLARQRTLDFVAVRVQFFVKNVHVLT